MALADITDAVRHLRDVLYLNKAHDPDPLTPPGHPFQTEVVRVRDRAEMEQHRHTAPEKKGQGTARYFVAYHYLTPETWSDDLKGPFLEFVNRTQGPEARMAWAELLELV